MIGDPLVVAAQLREMARTLESGDPSRLMALIAFLVPMIDPRGPFGAGGPTAESSCRGC